MHEPEKLVEEFHRLTDVPVLARPEVPSPERLRLRLDLMREELDEIEDALEVACSTGNVADALKELCDLQYVLSGTFLELGLHKVKAAAFAEVHRSNMSKLDATGMPIRRADGKILKGPNYSPADMRKVLLEAQKV